MNWRKHITPIAAAMLCLAGASSSFAADKNTSALGFSPTIWTKFHDNGDGTFSQSFACVFGCTGGAVTGTVGIDGTTPGVTNGVVVNSSALPTGAATAPATYALLTNASASGGTVSPVGGNYILNLSGTFGGATVGIKTTWPNGDTTTINYTAATGASPPCSVLVAGSTVQALVTGGSPSGLNATLGGVGSGGCAGTTATVTDPNNAAFQGVVAMTVGTTYTAQRSIGMNCTLAGNVAMTFPDASILIIPVQVGFQTFPFAITAVNTSGTTATCTYSNLK